MAAHSAQTSAYTSNQASYSNGCAVRDEEAAGSNPATPTQLTGHSPRWDVAFLYAVQQQVQQRPTLRLRAHSVLASDTSVWTFIVTSI